MRTRSIRRHNAEKIKRRCLRFMRYRFGLSASEELADDLKFVGRLTQTRKPCSCFMCGNPRKYFNEKTIRERRQELSKLT